MTSELLEIEHPCPVRWGLLDFPSEIRLQIYGYLNPANMHAKHIRSLMWTCSQVREECKKEMTLLAARLVEEETKVLHSQQPQRAILLPISGKLYALSRLTVELRGPIFPKVEDYMTSGDEKYLDPGVLNLLKLHLSELTIQLRDFSETTEDDFDPSWTPCELLRDMDVWFNGPPPRIRRAVAKVGKAMPTFQPVNRRALRTEKMSILWQHPSCNVSLATYRHKHYVGCMYTMDFRNTEEDLERMGIRPVVSEISFEKVGIIEVSWGGIER